MDDLDSLSDAALFAKSCELGLSRIPICPQTRKLVIGRVREALKRRNKTHGYESSDSNTSSPSSPRSSSTPILDRRATRATVARNITNDSANTSNNGIEPMEVDEMNGHADDRPAEPSLKRPFFSSTMRNSPLLKPVPAIDIAPRYEDGEQYLSEFGRRLSRMKTVPPTKQLISGRCKPDMIKETDFSRLSYKNTKVYDISKSRPNKTSSVFVKSNLISLSLLILFVVFFGFILVKYVLLKSDIGDIYKQNYPNLVCSDQLTKNCIKSEDFDNIVNAFKLLQVELNKRAVNYICGVAPTVALASNVKPYMTLSEVRRFLSFTVDNDLKSLILYIWSNNNFGVDFIEILGDEVYEVVENIHPFLDSLQTVSKNTFGFIVMNPNLSVSCTLFNFARNQSKLILSVFIGLIGILLIHRIVYHFINKRKQHDSMIRNLISETIEMLQAQDESKKSGKCSESYIPVNHIRDTLISSEKRLSMERVWNEAKRIIKETESRVRVETRLVAGEEFEVWSWIGSNLNLSRNPNSPKSWQGQAFETQAGSINNPQCSPTSCLKIRGMLNKNEKNFKEIEDAVVSKCKASNCKVLHCASDPQFGCVYLKCNSVQDAATAYQELHGWWYDGNLVTVKHLREERYHERFPDSVNVKSKN